MARLFLTEGEIYGIVVTDTDVIGTNGDETVVVGTNGIANFDPSFNRGGDEIVIQGDAADYLGARVGSSLVITNGSIASITIPIGTAGTTITFDEDPSTLDGDSFTLLTSGGAVTLGDQVITTTPAALDGLGEPNAALSAALSAAPLAAEVAADCNYLVIG
jgi:hypothetical protein